MRQAMSPVWILAALTLVIGLAGGLLPVLAKWKQNQQLLHRMTCVASGFLLASALLVVIPEGFTLADSKQPLLMGGAILTGFLLMLVLEGSGIGHAVHEEHHDHDEEHGHTHVHHQTAPLLLVLGLSLHAAADGLAVGSAAASSSGALTSLVALAVILHKVPAAFSLGVFSMHQHTERSKAVRDVLLFSLATPLFIILAYLLLQNLSDSLIGLVMLFAAGTFLYVATVDTLPDIHSPETGRRAMLHVLLGAILLSAVFLGIDAAGLIGNGH